MKTHIFNEGDSITLSTGAEVREFVIVNTGKNQLGLWYERGASAICYDAFYLDKEGDKHYGKLKMFYSDDDGIDFKEKAAHYISPYKNLQKLISDDIRMDSLYTFVPVYQIYKDESECLYLWSDCIPILTFEKMIQKLYMSNDTVEETLFEIVRTVKSLTDCIRYLHANNLIHGDIKPSNFGFYYRDEKVLADAVSLFDLDMLRNIGENPTGYTEPYYDPRDKDTGVLPDVRAIGVSLCKGLQCDDDSITTIIQEDNPAENHRRESIQNLLFRSELFVRKGVPKDKRVKEQFLKIVLNTLTTTRSKRFQSCSILYKELQLLETYLLPYCKSTELSRGLGIEIVNKEVRRKDRVKQAFQYLLYERPLYLWGSSDDQTENVYRVLLFGFGLDAQHFLDVCLETSQSMKEQIEVYVYGTKNLEKEKKYYLEERPALQQFFKVDGLENDLTGNPYGVICFREYDRKDFANQIETILAEVKDAQYVFVAAGNDSDNLEIAQICADVFKDAKTSINALSEMFREDSDGIHFVSPEAELRETDTYREIDRMSFNTHLVWSGTLNEDLEKKHEEYARDYYHEACLSNVLSIQYKLHTAGISISEDCYKAAVMFDQWMMKNPEGKKELIASEHRRWITEKICDGWTSMSVEDSLSYNDTKDILGKRHICLLRSSAELSLSDETWTRRGKWDEASDEELLQLDELDRMSVLLHRAYRKDERNMIRRELISEAEVRDFLYETRDYRTIQELFLEWREYLMELFHKVALKRYITGNEEQTIEECETVYTRLLNEIDKIEDGNYPNLGASLKNHLGAIHRRFEPLSRCLKYHDYKQNDVELIEKIPFILSYTDNISLIVPIYFTDLSQEWEKTNPTRLFSIISAATIINPRFLFLPYSVHGRASRQEEGNAREKITAIRKYFERKRLRTELIVLKVGEDRKISGLISDCSEECGYDIQDGWSLVQLNKAAIMTGLEKTFDYYYFDMKSMEFTTSDNAAWLNSIKRNTHLTVRDIVGLLGRDYYQEKDQPYFRKNDYKTLWKIYSSNRMAWDMLCKSLQLSKNKTRVIETFRVDSEERELKSHYYTLPAVCYRSASKIIELLKETEIIEGSSWINRYSVSSCNIMVAEKRGYGRALDRLFAKHHWLMPINDYDIKEDDQRLLLRCDSLMIKGIDQNFHLNQKTEGMLKILQELQVAGYIQFRVHEEQETFDITYGSRDIKDIFMMEGSFFEIYTYNRIREAKMFDDVVTGCVFRNKTTKLKENEFDCFATKGFQTIIIECKARTLMPDDSCTMNRFLDSLEAKVRKYGVNGSGLLVIDSKNNIPSNDRDYDNIHICSNVQEITQYLKCFLDRREV